MKLYYRFRRQDFSDQCLFSMKTFSISRNVHRWLHCAPWQFIQGQNNSEGTAAAARCTGSGRFSTSLWIRSAVRVFFFPSFPLTTINQLSLPPPCDWLMLHLFFGMHLPKCAPPLLLTHTSAAPQSSLFPRNSGFIFFFFYKFCTIIIAHLRNLFRIPRIASSTGSSSSSSTVNKSLICVAGTGAETYQLPLQKQHVLSHDEQRRQVVQSCKSIKRSYLVYIRSNYCNPNCNFHCTAIPDLQSPLKIDTQTQVLIIILSWCIQKCPVTLLNVCLKHFQSKKEKN